MTSIRPASAAEVVDVRHAVLRAGRPRETAIFAGDDDGRHWVAVDGDRVVGVATVVAVPWTHEPVDPPIPALQLRGMAVLPAHQGTGIGAALLVRVQADLGVPLWCNARERVVPFYERHGWIRHGTAFDIAGVGPHVRMTWAPTARGRASRAPEASAARLTTF